MNSKDDDFNYDNDFKARARTGVATFLSTIKNSTDLSNDSQGPSSSSNLNTNSLEYLRAVCDTGSGGASKPKQSRNKNLYCEVCDIDLTSDIVYEQHLNGTKHAKKLRNLSVLFGNSEAKIAGGPSAKKKAKITSLREELKDSKEPLIGLQYIEEFLPETDGTDFEPMYGCTLCCVVQVGVVPMTAHIVGSKHRVKYLEMRYGLNQLDKFSVIQEAERIEAHEGGRNLDLIKTIISDVEYPFPPNKAPIKLQTTASSEHPSRSTSVPKAVLDKTESLSTNPVGKLLKSISECSIKNEDDATLAFSVSSALVASLIAYKVKHIENVDSASLVISNGEKLIENLRTIYNIPTNRTSEPATIRSPHRRSEYEEDSITSRRRHDDTDYRRESGSYPVPESYYSSSRGRGSADRDHYHSVGRYDNIERRREASNRDTDFDFLNDMYATKQSRRHPY